MIAKQVYLALLGLVVLGASVASQESPPGFGAAAQFRLGVGARPLALGSAYTALAEGPESLYWNPAGLSLGPGSIGGTQIYPFLGGFGAELGLQVQYIGAAIPYEAFGFGVGWFSVRVNDIPYVTDDDIVLYFNYDSSLVLGGVGWQWGNAGGIVARVGATAKLYRESMLDAFAQGVGWDIGLLLDFGQWCVGYASHDVLGTRYRWRGTGQEPVVEAPWVHRLGGTVRWLDGDLLTVADVVLESPNPVGLRVGVEWAPVEMLALRGGVRLDPIPGGGLWPIWTAGFGVVWELFVLDAAYVGRSLATLGGAPSPATYVVSLGIRF